MLLQGVPPSVALGQDTVPLGAVMTLAISIVPTPAIMNEEAEIAWAMAQAERSDGHRDHHLVELL